MVSPLFVNGLTDLDKLIPPFVTVELTFEAAKPSFYLVSNDETKGIFKIEDMQIIGTFHKLQPTAFDAFTLASKREIPRFNYKESAMNYEFVKANTSSYRFRLEPTMLPHSALPEKLFLSFTRADSFAGSYKHHGGWLKCELLIRICVVCV